MISRFTDLVKHDCRTVHILGGWHTGSENHIRACSAVKEIAVSKLQTYSGFTRLASWQDKSAMVVVVLGITDLCRERRLYHLEHIKCVLLMERA